MSDNSDCEDKEEISNEDAQEAPNNPPATFESLGMSPWILKQLSGLGISRPSPVQLHCIPPILAGRDCVGIAKTGQGKTLAFALPILQTLAADPYGIYAVVLTPTRELAGQVISFLIGRHTQHSSHWLDR
jgi:ATP-dependent RNA helicase DDX49/DBP8